MQTVSTPLVLQASLSVSICHPVWILPDIPGRCFHNTKIIWHATDDHCVWRIHDITCGPYLSERNQFEHSTTTTIRRRKSSVRSPLTAKYGGKILNIFRFVLQYQSDGSGKSCCYHRRFRSLWDPNDNHFSISVCGGHLLHRFVQLHSNVSSVTWRSCVVGVEIKSGKVLNFFSFICSKQITRMRIQYFSSMIRQEIGFFDCSTTESNVAVRISE